MTDDEILFQLRKLRRHIDEWLPPGKPDHGLFPAREIASALISELVIRQGERLLPHAKRTSAVSGDRGSTPERAGDQKENRP